MKMAVVRYENVPAAIWPNGEENTAFFLDSILLSGEPETVIKEPIVEDPIAKAPQTFDSAVLLSAVVFLSFLTF